MKKYVLLTALASIALLPANLSVAEQGGAGHYISGQFTDFAGLAPTKSGWNVANYVLNYNDGTFSASRGLPFGNVIALNATANYTAEVPLVIYAYPYDFFGGTLSTGVAFPFMWLRVKAEGTIDNNGVPHTVSRTDTASGLGDIEIFPIMAGWTNGDFHFTALMSIYAPSGEYDKNQLANTGMGYWTFTPMVGCTWLSSKIGTEVSVFTGLDFNTENIDANYQSGNIYHVDATVAQHLPLFGGLAGAGVSAFYLKQISADSGAGAKLGGFEAESYGIGPTLSYAHHIGKSTLVADVSWLPQAHTQNTTKGNFLWIKLGMAF